MRAFIPNLETKLRAFGIAPKFFDEFRQLVEHGTPPSNELGRRLSYVKNYQSCLASLLAELSQPVVEKHFPPVAHFESLEVA